ncbi:hypothetical protein NFI96_030637 [Prochilodus magdalenae]|nr:hypothetical protein NFI96_030637 [Prochilodus magdalenae]
MQEPTTVSEVRSFLGMGNQLGKFIPQLAQRDKPLRDLLSKKNCWMWGIEQARAFQDLKDALTSPLVLAMYDPNRECKVSADASSYGLGGVLLQKHAEEWRPIDLHVTVSHTNRAEICKGSKTYLPVVDYALRYVEIALLTPTRSNDVIHHLKSIFARHGICETLVTGNGPQFSGAAFREFAESYGFHHVTRSPKYPQGNAEAERAVQKVKGLLKKSDDPYLALLAYRATPPQNRYSPAQLLMGRRLRTTVPILPALLDPALPDRDAVMLKERERRMKDAQHRNLRHRAQNLNRLAPGQDVWVTDQKAAGAVIGSHTISAHIWWRDPMGSSGETIAISSPCSLLRSRVVMEQLSISWKAFQANL